MMFRFLLSLALVTTLSSCAETEKIETAELNDLQSSLRTRLFDGFNKYADADVYTGMKGFHGQTLAMAGREDMIAADGVLRSSSYICPAPSGKSDSSPSLSEQILDVVGSHRIVIINEDHSVSRDRAVIRDILPDLRAIGFTHYAAETFPPLISSMTPEAATIGMGHYSDEPEFGRTITTALELDYKLVAYEQTEAQSAPQDMPWQERIPIRERAQAENLTAILKTLSDDDRIIIHVGHSHVAERPIPNRSDSGETEWMASRLKRLTGLDPLTISQTACRSDIGSAFLASNRVDATGLNASLFTDYAVAHLPMTFKNGRPDWQANQDYHTVEIPAHMRNTEQVMLYEARPIGASDAVVPSDRLLVGPEDENIPLLLPAGRYRLDAFGPDGSRLNSQLVTAD